MHDRSTKTAIVFTIIALGFSVLYWMTVMLSRSGTLPFSMEQADFGRKSLPGTIICLVFETYSPLLAAVIAVASCRGHAALANLGRSLVRWRVPGWRGVLLPELLAKLRPLPAATIVGFVWYSWHVPLYAASGRLNTALDHLFFLYTCIALSIIFTWF